MASGGQGITVLEGVFHQASNGRQEPHPFVTAPPFSLTKQGDVLYDSVFFGRCAERLDIPFAIFARLFFLFSH
jgi:hypothetical protein